MEQNEFQVECGQTSVILLVTLFRYLELIQQYFKDNSLIQSIVFRLMNLPVILVNLKVIVETNSTFVIL